MRLQDKLDHVRLLLKFKTGNECRVVAHMPDGTVNINDGMVGWCWHDIDTILGVLGEIQSVGDFRRYVQEELRRRHLRYLDGHS